MSPASPQSHDALAALERLYHKKVITLEEGQTAARLIIQDPAYVFPAPPPPKPTPAPAAPKPEPAPKSGPAEPKPGPEPAPEPEAAPPEPSSDEPSAG